ncbi:MAG: hypothetical protein ACJ71N_05385 [Terriglobales bacterium]|jgi:hypothetical protein
MRRTVLLVFAIFLVVMTVSNGRATPKVLAAPQQHRDEPQPPDPTLQKMQKEAEKRRNERRQSELKRDTDQLYKLAAELKKSVDSTTENVLSVEVLRKTEEIQKLAKSVHDKMKAEGYGSTLQ